MSTIRPETIEAMAPDQASLAAAVKLLKAPLWSGTGSSADGALIWGACQGSGANPYLVAADLVNPGSKCTCPSRKFPCKHGLALMLMQSRGASFAKDEVPQWVVEWMGRRKTGPAAAVPAGPTPSLAAIAADPEAPPDPRAEARREAQRQKREADTAQSIRAGLVELEGWIADQLRTGLPGLLAQLSARCRQIAARLVDAKMGALAARLDEIPARIQSLPPRMRIAALVAELGNLVLIARAWSDDPDPGLRRQVATTEPREVLLADPLALRVTSAWQVAATREVIRRDGLVAQSTWVMNLGAGPDFALLQDFFPASAGRRSAAFVEGEVFGADMVFYPAAHPLRAQIVTRRDDAPIATPLPPPDPLTAYARALGREPWLIEVPLRLPKGRLVMDEAGETWWQGLGGALPVQGAGVPEVAFGVPLTAGAVLWNGHIGTMLQADTPLGRVGFHD